MTPEQIEKMAEVWTRPEIESERLANAIMDDWRETPGHPKNRSLSKLKELYALAIYRAFKAGREAGYRDGVFDAENVVQQARAGEIDGDFRCVAFHISSLLSERKE